MLLACSPRWSASPRPRWRMPGLKWGRTWWLAMKAGGPFLYTGKEMRDAHFDLEISPEVFDEASRELANALDDFSVPEREKQGVLAALAAEKGEVTAGSPAGGGQLAPLALSRA
jgi:hemoglobin